MDECVLCKKNFDSPKGLKNPVCKKCSLRLADAWRDSEKKPELPAIDQMRAMVNYFDSQHEGHNSSLSMKELHKIWTFLQSEQGGRVHECYDRWPDYLLEAVLLAPLGGQLPEKLVKQASEEAA